MRALGVALAVVALAACEHGSDDGRRFEERGIALELPDAWSATGFSVDVIPRRLVAASYDVLPADVEGDCGGRAAILRLPEDGAYVLLVDYDSLDDVAVDTFGGELPPGSGKPFSAERFGDFECFGPGYLFRFVVDGRALQAHVGLGRDATPELREEAVAVLRSIAVER